MHANQDLNSKSWILDIYSGHLQRSVRAKEMSDPQNTISNFH